MKKTILILIVAFATTFAFGKEKVTNKAKSAKVIDYYGIDFSLTQVQGVTERPSQFKEAFYNINNLVMSEYEKKYNIAEFLNKESVNPLIDFVQKRNKEVDVTKILGTSLQYRLTDAQVDSLVQSLDVSASKNEVGVIFIAELLSKTLNQGFYRVVYFETATKKIITSQSVVGKAAGFGVRNFWAGSFAEALKECE